MALASIATSALALTGLALTGPAAVAAPSASAGTTCHYADPGTGTYADTLCWLDFSDYDAAAAASGQAMDVSLPGGYTLSFTMTASGGPVGPHVFPTWSGSYLGNHGHYTGVDGQPALYQVDNGTKSTVTLSDITLTDSSGASIDGFALVGADAESTDGGEWLSWSSDKDIESINPGGDFCGGGFTGVGTTSVTCTGSSAAKTGTAIVAATDPSTFTQTMQGSGLEAFAFGVLVSNVQLKKVVTDGFAGDSFGVSIATPKGSVLASASTGSGSSADTGRTTVVVGSSGSDFVLSEKADSGTLANYNASWQCTRNGTADASLPSGTASPSQTVHVGVGDSVVCTITNAGKLRALALTKKAGTPKDVNADGITDAGDTIGYTFTVLNPGLVTMHDIAVSDAKVGAVTCEATTLAPGVSTTCTADAPYVITTTDQDAGSVDNTATASGLAPSGTQRVDSNRSSTSTPVEKPNPAITLKKSATDDGDAITDPLAVGDTIDYHFVVTNTGNVPLSDVSVAEAEFNAGGGTAPTITCPTQNGALQPAAQLVCDAGYTVTQADIDAGITTITNGATAEGTPPGTTTPTSSPESKVSVPTAKADPSLALSKTADASAPVAAGQTVTYTFVVTNNGNVTVRDVGVQEGAFDGAGSLSTVTCPAGTGATTLVPGQRLTCHATYVVTQADVDAGHDLVNHATASGIDPSSKPVTTTDAEATVEVVPAAPGLTLVKSAGTDGPVKAGQQIDYTFTVTNSGNVTVKNVGIDEGDFTGQGTLGAVACGTPTTLAPKATLTCHADYTVTPADVDGGDQIANTATAEGTSGPGDDPVTSNESTTRTPTVNAAPALTLTKSVQSSGADGVHSIHDGDVLVYSFLVTNTGNVTLTDIGIDETAFTGHGTLGAIDCPDAGGSLAPGAHLVCTADYTITQQDVDAGGVSNTASAHGTPPETSTPVPSGTSTTVVPGQVDPALSLVKTSNATSPEAIGALVSYTFTVTNTGNVTLHGIRIDEGAFTGHGTLSAVTCPPGAALAPGSSLACAATYTVVKGDSAGTVANTATAEGTAPAGDDVASDPSSTDFTVVKVDDPSNHGTGPTGPGTGPSDPGNGSTGPAGGSPQTSGASGTTADPSSGDDSGALAITGSDVWVPLSLGGLLLLAGIGAVIFRRRRRA